MEISTGSWRGFKKGLIFHTFLKNQCEIKMVQFVQKCKEIFFPICHPQGPDQWIFHTFFSTLMTFLNRWKIRMNYRQKLRSTLKASKKNLGILSRQSSIHDWNVSAELFIIWPNSFMNHIKDLLIHYWVGLWIVQYLKTLVMALTSNINITLIDLVGVFIHHMTVILKSNL